MVDEMNLKALLLRIEGEAMTLGTTKGLVCGRDCHYGPHMMHIHQDEKLKTNMLIGVPSCMTDLGTWICCR